MKYLLTLIAISCLISIYNSPSEVVRRDNERAKREEGARPSVGTQIPHASLESEELLSTPTGIASYQMESFQLVFEDL